VSGEVVEFRLTLDGRVTWRKTLNLPDGSGNSWNISADGANATAANTLWAGQVANGQSLTFSKAKLLGGMSSVLTLSDLRWLVGGDRVTFTWISD